MSCAPLLLHDLEPDRGRMVRVTPPLRCSLHEAKAEGRRGSWRCVIEPNTVVDDLDTETIGDRRHLDPNLVRSRETTVHDAVRHELGQEQHRLLPKRRSGQTGIGEPMARGTGRLPGQGERRLAIVSVRGPHEEHGFTPLCGWCSHDRRSETGVSAAMATSRGGRRRNRPGCAWPQGRRRRADGRGAPRAPRRTNPRRRPGPYAARTA